MSPFLINIPIPLPEKSTLDLVIDRSLADKLAAGIDGLLDFRYYGLKERSNPKAIHKPPGG